MNIMPAMNLDNNLKSSQSLFSPCKHSSSTKYNVTQGGSKRLRE